MTARCPALAADAVAQPLFHLAPVVLDEPDLDDALDNTASGAARRCAACACRAGGIEQRESG
ncbi:MAG: hypothetical protein IPL70_06960 [Uliginosibacterium sp.]|nr:hypothetical protein [Uliginosibacterium sp.]